MTQENKLLLRELSARLPYGVKASFYGFEEECECIDIIDGIYPFDNEISIGQYGLKVEEVKPYLFPIESITEELLCRNGLSNVKLVEEYEGKFYLRLHHFGFEDYERLLVFFYENHIDYNGLIEKGLAKDASGLNIY